MYLQIPEESICSWRNQSAKLAGTLRSNFHHGSSHIPSSGPQALSKAYAHGSTCLAVSAQRAAVHQPTYGFAYNTDRRPTRTSPCLGAVNSERASSSLSSQDLEIYSVTGPISYPSQKRPQQTVDVLTRSLGVKRQVAIRMVDQQPQLADMSADEYSQRLGGLCRLLSLSRDSGLALVSSYPFLLVKGTSEVAAGISRIAEAMDVGTVPVCKLVFKQPYVLQSSTQFLKLKFDGLCGALHPLERDQAAYLIAALPDIIMAQPESLKNNMRELQHLFGLTQQQVADLVMKDPKIVLKQINLTQHDLFVLSNYIGVPLSLTAELVVLHPHLLGASWQTVKAHFDKLCIFFGDMPREAVVQLVIQNPSLLPLLHTPHRPDV